MKHEIFVVIFFTMKLNKLRPIFQNYITAYIGHYLGVNAVSPDPSWNKSQILKKKSTRLGLESTTISSREFRSTDFYEIFIRIIS